MKDDFQQIVDNDFSEMVNELFADINADVVALCDDFQRAIDAWLDTLKIEP